MEGSLTSPLVQSIRRPADSQPHTGSFNTFNTFRRTTPAELRNQQPLFAIDVPPTETCYRDSDAACLRSSVPDLACLDVFCGLCILGFVLSRDLGERFPVLGHSAWDGVLLGDALIPALVFAVGARTAWVYHSLSSNSSALYQIFIRSIGLFLLGVFLEGGFFHAVGDLAFGVSVTDLRIMGFLQRVAIAFVLAGLCHLVVIQQGPRSEEGDCCSFCAALAYHWQAAAIVAIAYLSLTFLLYVPDWKVPLPLELAPGGSYAAVPIRSNLENTSALGRFYEASAAVLKQVHSGLKPLGPSNASLPTNASFLTVPCGTTGDLTPGCNAAGYIDRLVLGMDHLYRLPSYRNLPECVQSLENILLDPTAAPAWCLAPFEPAGILSTLGSVLTALLGLHFGHILKRCETNASRLAHIVPLGLILSASGYLLQFPFSLSLAGLFHLDSIPEWVQVSSPGIPWNLNLFSVSFALLTSGAACLALSLIYVLVDVAHVRFYTKLLEWSGRNWLALYSFVVAPLLGTLLAGFYWKQPENNLIGVINWALVQLFHDPDAALIAGVVLKLLACGLFCGALHSQGMHLAL